MNHCSRILALIVTIILLAQAAAAEEPKPEELYAKSAVLIDGSSGRVLYGKNENQRMPMASTTKIMTCILALEKGDLSQECEFSAAAASAPKVKLGAPAGRKFLLEDLLYSLMLESHNDSAVAVAEAVAGSTEGFAVLMNEKAAQLGLENTSFVTPNGLDADGHYTTAAELALIMKYCLVESPKREEFLTITRRQSYTFSDLEQKGSYTVVNHNAFLNMMDGVVSGKTGFTGKAGYCYVCALERDGRLFIVSLLACGWPGNRTYKWFDTRLLMKYGIDSYTNREEEVAIGLEQMLPVENGVYRWFEGETESAVEIRTDAPQRIRYLMSDNETVEVRVKTESCLQAPVSEGQVVGTAEYWIGDTCMDSYPVTVCRTVERLEWDWYLQEAAKCFVLPSGKNDV